MDERAQWRLIALAALVVTCVMVLLGDRPERFWAIGFLLVGAVWFALRPPGYYSGLLVLFVAAEWCTPDATYALFALLPQVNRDMSAWPAFRLTALFGLTPWLVAFVRTGDPTRMLAISLMILMFSQLFAWVVGSIADKNERIAELSRAAGVAAERERLSAEIHDTLAQGFTSIVTLVQAAQADPDSASRHLDLAVRTARENLAEARALVAALAPASLDGSLASAVQRLVSRMVEVGITGTFRQVGVGSVDTSVEVVLLRTTQEALTNVRKHSGARAVDVTLEFGESVRLVVRDDGRGFRGAVEGFGLRGMRARVEQVGGTLTVSDVDGTRLVVEVPQRMEHR